MSDLTDAISNDLLDVMLTGDKVITALLADLRMEVYAGQYAIYLNTEPGVGSKLTLPPAFFEPGMN